MLQVSFTRNILKEAQELVYLGTHCNSDVHKQVIRQLNSGHLRRRSKSIEHNLNYHVREHTVTCKIKEHTVQMLYIFCRGVQTHIRVA